MSQLSKRGGCPTLPGQTGDWGGGGGDIGEAGDWQRIRGGQTSDRLLLKTFFGKFLVVGIVFLVLYNRQRTGTDLGMDKHQIVVVVSFASLLDGTDNHLNKWFW